MSDTNMNTYKAARIRAGMTLERASELLDIERRTLYNYESGARRPKIETVLKMCKIYLCERLLYDYFADEDYTGQIVPKIDPDDLPQATLKVLKESDDVEFYRPDLIAIASDGHISADERSRWEIVKREIIELYGALNALRLIGDQQNNEDVRKEGGEDAKSKKPLS